MLKRVVITNYLGETMEYKIDGVQVNNPSGLIITSIDGLGPVKANINMTDLVTTDGSLYNSSRLNGRNIVIKALFTHASSIEEARLLSYKMFPIKRKLKIRVETDNRIGETEGYVESNEPDIFSEESSCQISILCESPFFDGGQVGFSFSEVTPLFKFPFGNPSLEEKLIKIGNIEETKTRSIFYSGDYETGIEMTITSKGDASNISIYKENEPGNIVINTDELKKVVPDTETGTISTRKVSISYDESDSYVFFSELPRAFEYGSAVVVYHDELYVLGYYNNSSTKNSYNEMYKWDGTSWNKVCDLPLKNGSFYAVVYDDCIFLSSDWPAQYYGQKIYKWDGVTWTLAYNKQQFSNDERIGVPVSSNDGIYYVGGQLNATVSKFGELIKNQSGEYVMSGLTPPSYKFVGGDGCAVMYNNQIHILGGTSYSKRHYKWNGTTTWSSVSTLPYDFYGGSAIVYNNEIHIFGGGTSATRKYHYKYNGSSWTKLADIPYDFYDGSAIVYDDKIYLFGTSVNDGTWPKPPNNTHLINDDKIVINTVNGSKSAKFIRDNIEYNILYALNKNPNWFKLTSGENEFIYIAGTGEEFLDFSIKSKKLYEGV